MNHGLDSTIKLSICIASFNRADYLAETLDSFVEEMPNSVELIFVDGASTDNTKQIISEYQSKFTNIKYVHLTEKGGVDKDFDIAVQNATGEYCWLLCDDDPLEPGAIQSILEQINKDEYSLLLVNATIFDVKATRVLNEQAFNLNSNVEIDGSNLDSIVKHTGNHLTYIGCVVINRELWLSRKREQYYGFEFIHFAVIFQDKLPKKVLLMAKPMIKIRYGNAQWTERALHIWSKKWPTLVWDMPLLHNSSKAELTRAEPLKSFRFLLIHRAKENISFAKLSSIKEISGFAACFAAFLFCMIPIKPLRFLLIKYFSQDAHRYAVSLYDLGWRPDE